MSRKHFHLTDEEFEVYKTRFDSFLSDREALQSFYFHLEKEKGDSRVFLSETREYEWIIHAFTWNKADPIAPELVLFNLWNHFDTYWYGECRKIKEELAMKKKLGEDNGDI